MDRKQQIIEEICKTFMDDIQSELGETLAFTGCGQGNVEYDHHVLFIFEANFRLELARELSKLRWENGTN